MDSNDVLRIIRKRQGQRSLRALATEVGVSPAYLSDVMLGRRPLGPRLLDHFGLERVTVTETTYRRKK